MLCEKVPQILVAYNGKYIFLFYISDHWVVFDYLNLAFIGLGSKR